MEDLGGREDGVADVRSGRHWHGTSSTRPPLVATDREAAAKVKISAFVTSNCSSPERHFGAPSHIRRKLVFPLVSKEPRRKDNARSVHSGRDDGVQVTRGQCKGQPIGRVVQVFRKTHESPPMNGRKGGWHSCPCERPPCKVIVTKAKLEKVCRNINQKQKSCSRKPSLANRKGESQIQGRKC